MTVNGAAGNGGALGIGGEATAFASGSLFDGNSADSDGGAVFVAADAEAFIDDATFIANGAAGRGGAVYAAGRAELIRMRLEANTAQAGSGVDVAVGGTLHGRDIAVLGNTATGGFLSGGGGLWVAGAATIANAEISGNSAYADGGIYVNGRALTLSNATVDGNEAALWGGGIRSHYGTMDISSSSITDKAVTGGYEFEPGSGGGIMRTSTAAGLTITNTIIAGNSAMAGDDLVATNAPTGLHGVIHGAAAEQWCGGALALAVDHALVLANAGMTAADVFAAADASGGGVVPADGGFGGTAALAPSPFNPMIGGAVARPGVDHGDLDGDAVTDAAADAAVPVDARGKARAALGADIGAYEAPGTFDTPPLRVATAADIIDHDDGLASLRDAIAWVNAGALSGTITFASGGR